MCRVLGFSAQSAGAQKKKKTKKRKKKKKAQRKIGAKIDRFSGEEGAGSSDLRVAETVLPILRQSVHLAWRCWCARNFMRKRHFVWTRGVVLMGPRQISSGKAEVVQDRWIVFSESVVWADLAVLLHL